jgi:hypothetical protein
MACTLSSISSSPGITLGFDFYCSPRSCRLVSWSVGQFFSRLALGHELYIEAQKKISPTSLLSRFLLPNFVVLNKTPKKL